VGLRLRCRDTLPATVDGVPAYETVVVDNAWRDGTADALAGRDAVTLIRNSRNRGFAEGVNQACAASSAPFVLLLNSDVEIAPGALSVLVRFLRDRPGAAGVGPLYLNP